MLYPIATATRSLASLDGLWQLAFDPERAGLDRDYPKRTPAATEPIAVPGSINEQLSDRDKYLHTDWVWYFTQFHADPVWRDRRVFLRFGSVTYRCDVYLNGKRVGSHEGGYLPFEFEVGRKLKYAGPNRLVVRVDNLLSETTIPQGNLSPKYGGVTAWRVGNLPNVHYDFFPFMGIHRPVVLYTTGPAKLEQLRVQTNSITKAGATVQLGAVIDGKADALRVRCDKLKLDRTIKLDDSSASARLSLRNVKPWNPGKPSLYDLTFQVLRDGRVLDEYVLPQGFRTVKVTKDKLLVNGKPVFLRGFGRHEDHNILGKGLSLPHLVKEYSLLDWVGANSFRTSHYPYSEQDMRLADQLGVMVIDESAANTLSMGAVLGSKSRFEKLAANHEQHVADLIERDFNHACVVAWSLGNECETWVKGCEPYFKRLVNHARKLDNSRPITFVITSRVDDEGIGQGIERTAEHYDLLCLNIYPAWYVKPGRIDLIEDMVDRQLTSFAKRYRKPIMLTEFGADAPVGFHALHDLMWTEEYQSEVVMRIIEAAERRPFVFGTHVWNLADFKVGQHTNRPVLNHKGVFTRDRHPKQAAHALRKHWRGEKK